VPFHGVMMVKARSLTEAEAFVAQSDGAHVDNDATLEYCIPDPRPSRSQKKAQS
jgi:hypothetical protein